MYDEERERRLDALQRRLSAMIQECPRCQRNTDILLKLTTNEIACPECLKKGEKVIGTKGREVKTHEV